MCGSPTLLGQLDKVQLLALLRPCDVPWQKRVHEGLEVWPPPLGQGIADLPVFIDTFSRELRAYRGQALIQSLLEAVDLLVLVVQVVTWSVYY